MERWQLLYVLLGLVSGVLALGYGVTTNASLVLVGLAALLSIALFFIVVRPTAYPAVMAGMGSLAVVSGAYLYLAVGQAIGGLLVIVGLAGLVRGVQVRNATVADQAN